MFLKAFVSVLFFLFFTFVGNAQDCTLDIGGKNAEMVVKVFQLNESQNTQMEAWSAELAITNKVIEEDIQKMFDSEPQSSPEELTKLAEKYSVLKSRMVNNAYEADKKLLATFNERQYERYLQLCNEAIRTPIKVTPVVAKDSIVDPE